MSEKYMLGVLYSGSNCGSYQRALSPRHWVVLQRELPKASTCPATRAVVRPVTLSPFFPKTRSLSFAKHSDANC